MRTFKLGKLIALCLGATGFASQAADVLVPPGAKATLSVEYIYEQVMNLKGEFGDAGTLTVRWRFAVQ